MIEWSDVLTEYVQFAGYFLAIGAAAYRYLIVSRLRREDFPQPPIGLRVAAALGALGAGLLLLSAIGGIQLSAIHDGKSFAQALPKNPGRLEFKLAMLAAALAGYALAIRVRAGIGWPVAAVAILLAELQPLVTSVRLAGRVNAVHVLAASTWLGTLTVMLFAGIRAARTSNGSASSKARTVAAVVNGFSPVALCAAGLVAITGITTAWLHLKHLAALWETSYGRALIVKLCLVGTVLALGWWNWKKVRPGLGAPDESIDRIERSATAEVCVAALVLAATAVLVSLPSPR